MRKGAAFVAFLIAAVAATPTGASDLLLGNVSAAEVGLAGVMSAHDAGLVTHLGDEADSFQRAPAIQLRGESIQVQYDYRRLLGVEAGGAGLARPEDSTSSDNDVDTYQDGFAYFQSWQSKDSQLAIQGVAGNVDTLGRVTGHYNTLASVGRLDEPLSIEFRPDEAMGFDTPNNLDLPAGTIIVPRPDSTERIEYTGTFLVFIYGATYELRHAGGVERYETGFRHSRPVGLTNIEEYWLNITVLTVLGGSLIIDPVGNPVDIYAEHVSLVGEGTVALRSATGSIIDDEDRRYALDGDDVDLVGAYDLALRSSEAGFLAGVSGNFDRSLFLLAATVVENPGFPVWWWAFGAAVGLTAATGGTLLIVRRRSQREVAPAPAPAVTKASVPVAAPPVEVPEAVHVSPEFGWDELTEEFGVVRAGEKAGVLIVLVPSDRVRNFLGAVVARGLLAEDTGDRVHAGEHELAVVALEPSPVMMN